MLRHLLASRPHAIRAHDARRHSTRLRSDPLEDRSAPAAFTSGNLVVVRVGDGSGSLTGAAAPVFIDEYATDGTAVHTGNTTATGNPLPTSVSGTNYRLVNGGAATSEGLMTLSSNGQYLVLTGYDADVGTAAIVTASGVDRVIGRVDSNGNIDTSTKIPQSEGYASNDIRAAASVNGTSFWTSGAGSNGGVHYATLGAISGSTQISTTLSNTEAIGIFDGQLYISSASGTFQGVSTVGSGLPTTSGQTITLLPGFPTTSGPSPYQFVFKDANTLYVADDRTVGGAGGVYKWIQSGGTWTLAYSIFPAPGVGLRGLIGDFSGADPVLYGTTTQASANQIVRLVDTGSGSIFTTIASAPLGTAFRSIAFAPGLPNSPPVNTLPASFTTIEDTGMFLTGISVTDADAGAADIQVTFSLTNGNGSTLTLKSDVAGGLTAGDITANGTGSVIVSAPISTINATLADPGGLKFTPAADLNSSTNGGDVTLTMTSNDLGHTGSGGPKTDSDSATIVIQPVADTPSVSDTTTAEDTQSVSGLVIMRNAADGSEVTHLKITAITNGTLFQNDGTTQIHNGDFIAVAEGSAGLKFTPVTDFFGPASFQIQASLNNDDGGLAGGLATATVTVNPVADTPSVSNTSTLTNAQTTSGLVISRNTGDGSEVTHFKVTAITNGTLFQNDGMTPINDGDFITFADGNAGLKFTPATDFVGTGSYQVRASLSNSDAGLGGSPITATIAVHPQLNSPVVTEASTDEDRQNTTGLVISPDPLDINWVTHFRITAITNGALYKNDGTTQIHDGDFITVAEGATGLRLTPAADYFGSASFAVESSTSASPSDVGGQPVTATVTVNPVNDPPTLDPLNNVQIDEDAAEQTIGLTGITVGPPNEAQSGQIIISVTATSDNHTLVADPTVDYDSGAGTYSLRFTPIGDANGNAQITVAIRDNGGIGSNGVDATSNSFTVTVNPKPDAPVLDTFAIPMLPAVPLRTIPTGTPISHLVEMQTDVDLGDPKGIAIVGLDDAVKGRIVGAWQYSLDGGTNWTNVPIVSPTGAFLLGDDANTRLRFLPNLGFTGYVSVRYRAWDQSDGNLVGALVDTTIQGNTTFSGSIERAWVAVGRARPIVNADGQSVLPSVREDRKSSAVIRVTRVLGLAEFEQPVSKGLGLALTAASASDGTWQFKLAGTKTWQDVGVVDRTSALLLRPTDSLRFVANANADGEGTLKFKTWDALTGSAGTHVNPGGGEFSVDGGSAILDIIRINDAPVLTLPAVPPTLNPVLPNQTSNPLLLSSILSASDVEGANIGVAIVGAMGSGTWQYSTDGGNTWLAVGTTSRRRPLFLDADTLVRFTASADAKTSSAALSFKAWDRAVDSRGRPLATSMSRETEILTVAVN